jgi:mannitol/fructose-specific phosphotransferase system IIA component (Ntr-type)
MMQHDSQTIATWQEAIDAAIQPLIDSGTAHESYIAAVIEREHSFPTGLPPGACNVDFESPQA